MLEFMSRLEQIRDTLRGGAGKAADVLAQVREAVAAAEQFLRNAEAGVGFGAAAVGDQAGRLDEIAVEFHALAAGPRAKGRPKKAAAVEGEAKLTPDQVVAVAMLAAQLIKLIRERRKK